MKKFLSLLLALTLVLSLVVVPARADATTDLSWTEPTMTAPTNTTAARGTTLTFTVSEPSVTKNNSSATKNTDYEISYVWSGLPDGVTSSTQSPNQATGTVTGIAGSYTVKCTVTVTAKGNATGGPLTKELSKSITISDAVLDSDVTTVSFNGRSYAKNAVLYSTNSSNNETDFLHTADKWTIAGYTVNSATNNSGTVTLNVSKTSGSSTVSGNITVTATAATATGNVAVSPSANHRVGQKMTFSLPSTVTNKDSSHAGFAWTVKSAASGTPTVAQGTSKTFEWTPVAANAGGTFTVECAVKEGSAEVGTISLASNITVAAENYEAAFDGVTISNPSAVVVYGSSQQATKQLPAPYLRKLNNTVSNDVKTGFTVDYQSSNRSIATVDNSGLVTAGSTTGTATITVKITYLDKDYTETYTIYNRAPSYTIPTSIQAGAATPYDAATLKLYASYALSSADINIPVTSINNISSVAAKSNCTVTQPTYGSTTYYVTGGTFGTATFTATVSTLANGTYPITFTVAVKPQTTTYEDQYPEPVAYGNTYRYYVQVPSGFTSYYVLGTPNQTTEPNWTLTGTQYYGNNLQYYGNNLYYLTDSNFVGGKCTLWLVTRTANGAYYCGQLTVYQKNYNINYNGVAGETVQFKHTDFTNFMNEVAQARGDSSKTGSYPYVTFSYVTFDYPSTAQGTLYYNGTAMSTSSYSGAFNSRTQITNLDNITFVPYAKTNAKTVAVNFTLHAVKYGTNGTVVNRDVQYRGTVNISLVREDVTFTVAPGDSVTFTDSAFLNYLRSASGINYNYNIDYVTFDQSAVDTINGGVLYSGYAGFNAVKPTDKFYYTTTNNYTQNALSDVTFRASTYAKTGTTVYIPFTIYARYGTTGTGTRQVTGTVAVKIAQTMNFVDVKPTDYFYNPVKWAVGKNITKGTSAVTFSPDRTCTRAEIVTFLWRDAGSPMPTISRSPFSDVNYSMGADFYNAILWASQNGITAGTDVSHFSPNKTCTRAEIVTFLWRYAKKPVGYGSNSFTDVNKNDHAPYYDAILWAVSKGITNGSTTTTFAPDGTCTRGQAVTFLYRYEGGK